MKDLIQVARGEKKADLLLKNARIVNVFTGTISSGNVSIYNGRIAGIGDYEAKREIDLKESYLTPGFIDSHVHIESSMVSPEEFASIVIEHGTTTVVADPHEIANVAGKAGITYMLEASKNLPISIYFMLPSCVPATHLETSGATLSASDLKSLSKEKSILGLAEMMNFPGVLHCDPIVLEKLESFESKLIDGHAPGLSGKDLCAYMAVGIYSDHESTTPEEALEKLRLGMYIMLREGTAAKDLKKLLPIIDDFTAPRCLLSTDDRHPEDLIEEGGIDLLLRMAMREGIHPIRAIQLATLNPANYFGLKDRGAISPGRIADLVILDDLKTVKVNSVLKDGQIVVREGELLLKPEKKSVPVKIKNSTKIREVKPDHFEIPVQGSKCRVVDIIPNEIITKQAVVFPKTKGGRIVSDIERDIIKIAVIERHSGTGNMFVGLVRGFGLKSGALASSVAHDAHNIVVVGVEEMDMAIAVNELRRMGGGLIAVRNREVMSSLPLPIAGLMSDRPVEEVYEKVRHLEKISAGLGLKLREPFMTLSFLSLAVIPELKITDKGLVDVLEAKIVDLFLK